MPIHFTLKKSTLARYVRIVYKFQDFTEIGESGVWKSAIFTNLDALNFLFHEFLQLLKAAMYQINKIQGPKMP